MMMESHIYIYKGDRDELFGKGEDLLIPLYKRMDTYNRKITPDTTLFEFIRQTNNPVATNIKSF